MTPQSDIDLDHKELERFYTNYFHYYTTLDKAARALFIGRCLEFVSQKTITGAEGFEPDNRVKAMIAASAVQLTLGLETWHLNYFNDIEIHPSDFDSASGRLRFEGETNLQGHIRLSWKSFIHGYQIDDDNLNLGLHEFSHALRFNSVRGFDQDYFVGHYFDKWMSCALDAFYDIRNKKESIFRKYGGENINEFLSVCIEHYFESPEEIKGKYPLLYYATGILLNQLPGQDRSRIGIRNDFLTEQNKLLTGFKTQKLQSRFLKHWTFKLWLFVLALLIYTFSLNVLSPINIGLSLVFILIFIWHDYVAVSFVFEGPEVHIHKGNGIFRNRKTRIAAVSQFISLRQNKDEWVFTYYDNSDSYFYSESATPPKDVNPFFLLDCRQNKIALLK